MDSYGPIHKHSFILFIYFCIIYIVFLKCAYTYETYRAEVYSCNSAFTNTELSANL